METDLEKGCPLMKNSSALILGLSIIAAALIVVTSPLGTNKSDQISERQTSEYRYELIPANDNNIIIFDKQTGDYWQKFIENNGGPTHWEKGDSPITTPKK